MFNNLFKKCFCALILLILMTYFICMMFINKDKELTEEKNQLNKDVINYTETFINELSMDKKREEFDYESYENQKEGFQSSPIIEGLDIAGDMMKAFTRPFQPLIDFFNKLKDAFDFISNVTMVSINDKISLPII